MGVCCIGPRPYMLFASRIRWCRASRHFDLSFGQSVQPPPLVARILRSIGVLCLPPSTCRSRLVFGATSCSMRVCSLHALSFACRVRCGCTSRPNLLDHVSRPMSVCRIIYQPPPSSRCSRLAFDEGMSLHALPWYVPSSPPH